MVRTHYLLASIPRAKYTPGGSYGPNVFSSGQGPINYENTFIKIQVNHVKMRRSVNTHVLEDQLTL
jgi:hypothetical protein